MHANAGKAKFFRASQQEQGSEICGPTEHIIFVVLESMLRRKMNLVTSTSDHHGASYKKDCHKDLLSITCVSLPGVLHAVTVVLAIFAIIVLVFGS